MAVVTATRTLDPSATHDDDSKTQRQDFLSICYLLQSFPSVFVLWTIFTGFVMSSGLRVAISEIYSTIGNRKKLSLENPTSE